VSCSSRAGRPEAGRAAVAGAGAAAVCFLLANPHALLSFDEFSSGLRRQASASSGFGKLGLDYDSGIVYYLWVSTWGLGWVPLAAAALGAAALFTRDRMRFLFLVPWPVAFVVFMGLQERYFGRWLLPALPALALLAGYAVVWLADRIGRDARRRAVLVACATAALVAQGLVYSVHADRVLARDDTRNLARAWMDRNLPPRAKVVVEPIVPDAWFSEPGSLRNLPPERKRLLTASGRRFVKLPTGRTTVDEQGRPRRGGVGRFVDVEDYERTTRPALVGSYERGGYCWVMIGSTQYGRAFRAPDDVPNAIAYYALLGRRGKVVYRADPYKDGAGPVGFNFDWSFDHYPMAYERPGPTVIVYRLERAACAPSGR
jgi:hypothetical protein